MPSFPFSAESASAPEGELAKLLEALHFAALQHRDQMRKKDSGPFINHPIAVAEVLARIGRVSDTSLLQAAFLHDVLEDTSTTEGELAAKFGSKVASWVKEVSDNMSLDKAERRRLQLEGAPHLSPGAKHIRIADKICNVADVGPAQPSDWSLERKLEYLDWAGRVVDLCRGTNPALEREFDRVLRESRRVLGG